MKYFNDKMDTLQEMYVSGRVHEIEYLKAIEELVADRLAWHKEENDKMRALLEA
jgi:hypothetical protein